MPKEINRYAVAICDTCGAVSLIDVNSERLSVEHRPDAEDQEPLSRCSLIYEKDWGNEVCAGDVYIRGAIWLDKISI